MYKKILFATDCNEEGLGAAYKAKRIADSNAAELFIVHVIEPIKAYSSIFSDIEASRYEHAKKTLTFFASKLGLDIRQFLIKCGVTKDEILCTAKEKEIDLIVTGNQGKHGRTLLLSSTAKALLQNADCDVLSLRHFESRDL